jgi:tRNA nucleotidyltransferase (CCA-adding enzyme)
VRYSLQPEPQTIHAMEELSCLMDNLARERVFEELCKLLPLVSAGDLLRFGPVLAAVIPELESMLAFDQHNPHHAYDLFTHTAFVVENVPKQLPLRWAALLHDTGKVPMFTLDENGCGHFYGHAKESAALADQILRRLKAPTDLREEVVQLISLHMTMLEPTRKAVRRWLSRLGREAMDSLLLLQKADTISKGTDVTAELPQFDHLQAILDEIDLENACLSLKDLAVNGHDLMQLGITGKGIGVTLKQLLDLVLDEQLPNEKNALLYFIKHNKEN